LKIENLIYCLTPHYYQMLRVLIILLWLPIMGFTQGKMDSLIAQLKIPANDQLDTIYYLLVRETLNSDPDLALNYAKLSLAHAIRDKNHEIEIRSTYAQGSIFIKKWEWDSALYYLKRARNISYEYKIHHRLPWIYGELGLIYQELFKFDLAIENYIESLKYAERFNIDSQIPIIHNHIGLINLRLENYEEALKFFREAIELKNQIHSKQGIIINKLNISICLNATGKYEEALVILNEILEECKNCSTCEECNENKFQVNLLNEMGLTHQNRGDHKTARHFYLNALWEIDTYSYDLYPATYGYLADVYFHEDNPDSSMYYLNLSNQAANKYDDLRTLILNKFLLSKIYEKKQRFREANEQLREAMNIKDKAFPVSMTENIRKSYIDYERYQSQQIIEAKEKIIQRNNQLTLLLAIVSLLSIVTFVFAFKNAAIRKKLNEKLSDEVYERTRELNNFLYRTSHDLAGPLARIKGLLKLINSPMNAIDPKQYLDRLNMTTEKLAEVIGRLESISKINVTPLLPEKISLQELLEEIVQKTKNGSTIEPEIVITGEKSITTDKNLLGQILQNLLQNSYHHIDRREMDKKIFVDISNHKNLTILVGDTGTGIIDGHEKKIFDLFFSSTDKNDRAGIGLYFANIAAKRLGGKISLKHNRKPTIFEVTIPSSRSKIYRI